jgi:predicted permease
MDAELLQHMAAHSDDLARSGMSRAEAERHARIEFGSVLSVKEECRQTWGLRWMDELRADLRLTSRALRQAPGFAATAILSLALGIGANTAIFGLVDAVILRTLPVREPERLVFVENVGTQGPNGGPPYPCFELLRDKVESFEEVAAFSASGMELVIDGNRELAQGVWVSGNFYELLGVRPLIGRTLLITDDKTIGSGGPDGPVAVISSAYWRQRFGSDPSVVGRSIRMFKFTLTIVGVMPAEAMSLEPGRPIDIAVPMMLSDPASLKQRGAWWLNVVARLKPDVRTEQARAESDVLFQAYMADLSISPELRKRAFDHIELASAARGMDRLRKQFSKPLTALVILVALVLLAACANVANLMVARATARRKEFAVRLAIGAGRGRLVRQTLTEASVLAAAGSVLGILLASQGEAALAAFFAGGANQIDLDLSLSGRVLLFTLTVSVLTTFAFGLFPALRAARVDPAAGLQSSSRSVGGSRLALRLGRSLVIVQVALSMVLVASAGLFIRSLHQLNSVDLGFVREGILTMEVTPEQQLSGKPEWLTQQTEILDRIQHLPGVRSASWSTMNPLSGRDRGEVLDVPKFSPRTETDKHVRLVSVSPQYFETFSLALLLGRAFLAGDDNVAPKVAILNETAARFYFGDANPIGEKVRFPHPRRPGGPAYEGGDATYEIVGVAKDAKHQASASRQGASSICLSGSHSTVSIGSLWRSVPRTTPWPS